MVTKRNKPRLTLEIDKDLREKFLQASREDGCVMSYLVIKWIKSYLAKRKNITTL